MSIIKRCLNIHICIHTYISIHTCNFNSLSEGWSSTLNSISANNNSASFSCSKSKSSLCIYENCIGTYINKSLKYRLSYIIHIHAYAYTDAYIYTYIYLLKYIYSLTYTPQGYVWILEDHIQTYRYNKNTYNTYVHKHVQNNIRIHIYICTHLKGMNPGRSLPGNWAFLSFTSYI